MIEKPGIIIKRLREERRIKAVDFAEKIGMSKECVFRSKKATLSEQTGRPFGAK
jgi:transcriptional regulator with XRE-family HTH domain